MTDPRQPYALAVDLTRVWGEAENGELFEVAIRPHLVEELYRRWPPVGLTRHTERPERDAVAFVGLSDSWVIVPDREESGDHPPLLAWDQLEQSLTVFAAHRLRRLVAVHSAAFAWGDRVVVVPAASGGGKSTLTVAANDAGATVLTDEYTLIDPGTGLVTGWNRSVRMIRDDGSVDRLDIATGSDPMVVGLIALVRHDPGEAGPLEPIAATQAVGELLAHTLCARSRPDDSFDAALAVARAAPAVAGCRGEAVEAVAELRRLLG